MQSQMQTNGSVKALRVKSTYNLWLIACVFMRHAFLTNVEPIALLSQ